MKTSNTPKPNVLDQFMQKLEEDAQANGYAPGLILNMKHDPAMMDILARMLGAELKAIKEGRKNPNRDLCEPSSAS